MAEESCCSKKIPNNEEIIEEVIKGVGDCVIKEECGNEKKPAPKFKDSSIAFTSELGCNSPNYNDDVLQNSELGCNSPNYNDDVLKAKDSSDRDDVNKSNEEDDFIDEESLKDAEGSLSQEEKEFRRDEAEGHKGKGNECFKMGEYRLSIDHYTLGLRTCPLGYPKERAILYSNRAAAKMKLTLNESAIEDCTKAVEFDPSYLKARYRRALLYEHTEKLEEALADYQEILKLDPLHREALYATKRLPEQIHERNEKMKTEMFAKLKDLGNMILRPFNLSTDNFHVNQDPNTGGYSINFKPNSS